jgi:hypothetical protein
MRIGTNCAALKGLQKWLKAPSDWPGAMVPNRVEGVASVSYVCVVGSIFSQQFVSS